MNDYELVITRCKRLESRLEAGMGAAGRGLHEKVSSVENRLSGELVRKLRFIATVRNKLVHEASVEKLEDRAGYARACDEADRMLDALLPPVRKRGRAWMWLAGVVILLAVALWLKFWHRG